ncbi:MAG: HAD family hydrolase [Candidatus Levyibacteriota bacterium]
MIKAIIFDLGGVLIFHRKLIISHILTLLFPETSLEDLLTLWDKYRIALNSGTISSKEMLEKMKKEFKSKESVDALLKQWRLYYGQQVKETNLDLLEVVKLLRKKYKVYLLTDTIDVHDQVNSKRAIYEQFDGVYKSFKMGMAKMDGENAFRYVISDIGASPEECVFIDDTERNIEIAKAIGMKAILFTDNEALQKEWKSVGII